MTATDEAMGLLPCPFCGGDDIRTRDDGEHSAIECDQCGAEIGGRSLAACIAAWNRRADPERLAAAERDAAVALMDIAERDVGIVYDAGAAEGERRATAAIVADLRNLPAGRFNPSTARIIGDRDLYLADRYERGDHIPSAGQ